MRAGSHEHPNAGSGFTFPRSPLCSSCLGRTRLQDVQLLTRGDGEAAAGGSCYVLFNRVYREMLAALSRRFDHSDVPYALIFVVTGQPLVFNETKMSQIKCDGEEGEEQNFSVTFCSSHWTYTTWVGKYF